MDDRPARILLVLAPGIYAYHMVKLPVTETIHFVHKVWHNTGVIRNNRNFLTDLEVDRLIALQETVFFIQLVYYDFRMAYYITIARSKACKITGESLHSGIYYGVAAIRSCHDR